MIIKSYELKKISNKNNVILIYNGYEVDTGIKLDIKEIPFRDINQLDGITI